MNRNDCPSKRGFMKRRASKKSETSDYETDVFEDFSGLTEFEMHMLIFNDDNLSENLLNRYSNMNMSTQSLVESEDEFLETNQDNKSNSKMDSYLDEMIELVTRDFVMVFLNDMLWEKEKFSAMIK